MTTTYTRLTVNEYEVLVAAANNMAAETGENLGCSEGIVVNGLDCGPKKGVLSSLAKKGMMTFYGATRTDSGSWSQYSLTARGAQWLLDNAWNACDQDWDGYNTWEVLAAVVSDGRQDTVAEV
jgi:hypothetical protein